MAQRLAVCRLPAAIFSHNQHLREPGELNSMRPGLAPLLLSLLLGACAVPEHAPQAIPPAEPAQPRTEIKAPSVATVPRMPKAGKPGPIPTRALNVRADCKFQDESGYNGTMTLTVEQARVQTFAANVNIPRRGNCKFDLKNFRQTREMPNVVLTHLSDRCIVHVWEQGKRVTVAFQQCQKMCSGNAWEGLWPILTDTRDGSCA